MKSSSFSIQENGDNNERPTPTRRRPSVLDEKALREADTKSVRDQRIQAISLSYQGILESIGEDPSRQGRRCIFEIWSRDFQATDRPSENAKTCR